jgi:O-succinylbenzoic acid--CoA ligase
MSGEWLAAAVAEDGWRPALIAGGEDFTFARLAAAVTERRASWDIGTRAPLVRVGDATFDTLLDLYAAIDAQRPLILQHPRWPEAERQRYLDTLGSWPPWAAELEGEESILAVLPTSGSSGRPKGVALSRRAFRAAAAASAASLGWRDDDRWLLSLPLAHVGGLSILVRCLLARRCMVVGDVRLETADLMRAVDRHRITLLSLVPTQLVRLLDAGWDRPGFVRAILLGGAAAPPSLIARAAERGWPLLRTYGLTEACSQVATQTRAGAGVGLVAGVRARCVEGLLEVAGETMMTSYLPSPTAGAGLDAGGYLRTGDLAELADDDTLRVLGRADDVIVTGGENVHPQEVEAAIGEHAAVRAVAVFGLPDAEWGQQVAAAIVAEPALDLEQLRKFLRPRLAVFKLPRRLFALDELPLTASGKIDRRRLRESLGL